MAEIQGWDNRHAARSTMYALDYRDGYLVWAKCTGTPTDEDWAVFIAFIRLYAPHARGLFSFLAGGAINVAQRAEVMDFLAKQARCRFVAITGENASKGSVTAMSWAGENSGYKGRSFSPAELDKALEFVEAKVFASQIKETMRRLIHVVGADPKGVLLPLLGGPGQR